MAQKRIRALDVYTQLDPGDAGYIAPSALSVVFDSDEFGSEPKRYPASLLFSSDNDAKGRLTGLSSRSVSVTFDTAFASTPLTVLFEVYRYTDIGGAAYVKQSVLKTFSGSNWLTASGFTCEIDASESLTGIYIEYYFIPA